MTSKKIKGDKTSFEIKFVDYHYIRNINAISNMGVGTEGYQHHTLINFKKPFPYKVEHSLFAFFSMMLFIEYDDFRGEKERYDCAINIPTNYQTALSHEYFLANVQRKIDLHYKKHSNQGYSCDRNCFIKLTKHHSCMDLGCVIRKFLQYDLSDIPDTSFAQNQLNQLLLLVNHLNAGKQKNIII